MATEKRPSDKNKIRRRRSGGQEEIPPCPRSGAAAVRRNPLSKVKETQIRW